LLQGQPGQLMVATRLPERRVPSNYEHQTLVYT